METRPNWVCSQCKTSNADSLPYCESCEVSRVDSVAHEASMLALGATPHMVSNSEISELQKSLEAFYMIFSPDRLPMVPAVAAAYAGTLDDLNQKLRELHGADLSFVTKPTSNKALGIGVEDEDEELDQIEVHARAPVLPPTSTKPAQKKPEPASAGGLSLPKPSSRQARSISVGGAGDDSEDLQSLAKAVVTESGVLTKQELDHITSDPLQALSQPHVVRELPSHVAGAFRFSQSNVSVATQQQYVVSHRMSTAPKKDLTYMEHAPMVVVPFANLVRLQRLPKIKHAQGMTVPYSSLERSRSLVVYISHNPTPKGKLDKKVRVKYHLIVQAIKTWLETWARGLEAFLWIQPVCAINDVHVRSILSYMERCDCVLTPIVDPIPQEWTLNRTHKGLFNDYLADHFKSYLATAWGRLEVLAATRVPRVSDTFDVRVLMGEPASGFSGRPHFIYGPKEVLEEVPPLMLPEVRTRDVEERHPLKGGPSFAPERDLDDVRELMKSLDAVYKAMQVVGYRGDTNAQGDPHGTGVKLFDNGDRYEGQWANGLQNGVGIYLYVDGSKYEGDWKDGKRHGKGKFIFWSGNVEECEYADDLQHGEAVFKRVGGGISKGPYVRGRREGEWVRFDLEGNEEKRLHYEDGVQVKK